MSPWSAAERRQRTGHGEGGDNPGEAADVIGMGVCRDDCIEPVDTLSIQVADNALLHPALPGIDEHRLVVELEEDRIALPDVDEVDEEIAGGAGAPGRRCCGF